jgi:predicted transcriptional regulator
MTFFSAQDITIISLILASFAVAIAIVGLLQRPKNLAKQVPEESLDAIALVKEFGERQKRLEQKMVDEKVRLEILELRISKQKVASSESYHMPPQGNKFGRIDANGSLSSLKSGSVKAIGEPSELALRFRTPEPSGKYEVPLDTVEDHSFSNGENGRTTSALDRRDSTTIEILQAVSDGDGRATARQIQERIGRSREHTARMMNELYKEGLVLRNVEARPFTYSLTDAGRNVLVRQ